MLLIASCLSDRRTFHHRGAFAYPVRLLPPDLLCFRVLWHPLRRDYQRGGRGHRGGNLFNLRKALALGFVFSRVVTR
jgi:hypothetical protein